MPTITTLPPPSKALVKPAKAMGQSIFAEAYSARAQKSLGSAMVWQREFNKTKEPLLYSPEDKPMAAMQLRAYFLMIWEDYQKIDDAAIAAISRTENYDKENARQQFQALKNFADTLGKKLDGALLKMQERNSFLEERESHDDAKSGKDAHISKDRAEFEAERVTIATISHNLRNKAAVLSMVAQIADRELGATKASPGNIENYLKKIRESLQAFDYWLSFASNARPQDFTFVPDESYGRLIQPLEK